MPSLGYVRFPTIHQDSIVFVCEDDLWLVSSEGGRAERLTASLGRVSHPHFSPNGQQLAFVGSEEGPAEVYVMPALGGSAQRLTFQAISSCQVLGWSPAGDRILYTSYAGQFTHDYKMIHALRPQGGLPEIVPVGVANAISYGPQGAVLIGRNTHEPAHWKRYRGGTIGHLWCDPDGSGTFHRLLSLQGNIATPCCVGERIYFLSDHEGIGNIYSCTCQGEDLRRHSNQTDFYARNLSTDGQRLVFHAGADLHLFDPQAEYVRRLDVVLPSSRTQLNRKFVSAIGYLDTSVLHPEGHALAVTTRGKAFSMSNWEGAVIQYGEQDGVRYRCLEWLNDGKRLVAVSDAPGREVLIIFDPEKANEPKVLSDLDIGRVVEMAVAPNDDSVAITNHRQELILVDLQEGTSSVLDRSDYARIEDLAWSPDGSWLAYSFAMSNEKSAIKLFDTETSETHFATSPTLNDTSPSFDPQGKYLYFLGERVFNPVRDNLHFEYSFPKGVLPYAIPLRRDLRSPFVVEPKLSAEKEENDEKEQEEAPEKAISEEETHKDENQEQEESEKKERTVVIDLEGITTRAVPFPVPEARYESVKGIKNKVLFLKWTMNGAVHNHEGSESKSVIEFYDFETQRKEFWADDVSSFSLSRNSKMLLYRSGHRLRVVKAGEKLPRSESKEQHTRESGWLDLSRIKVSVQPAAEWRQMFGEAWRLQREQFWAEDMSGVDWDAIYAQYAPLLERVGSRTEYTDLVQELLGELGTSHAKEHGAWQFRRSANYRQGFLGVDWTYDVATQRYCIARIIQGDPSDKDETSPFTAPGLNVSVGDAVLAINGQYLGPNRSPQELLVYQAAQEVQLMIESAENGETRSITVTALSEETTARYRDWVETNRKRVHTQSQGRVGYIHIPSMSANGFAEFHRSYLVEYDYPALIIDVRWNSGGHVSSLLLEKLARRRIGYTFQRWGQPRPYPRESPRGPMVALANEHTCSDGDIFSHAFKLMKLGPLVGKRTWGGVIGILPRRWLVDCTFTTQPEYASWFKDVGWNIENYGTDPDIEVDIAPQEYINNTDSQLERALAEALRLIDEHPVLEPKPEPRPRRGWPNSNAEQE